MKILTVSTLYPNAANPAHGVFVENRLAAYRQSANASVRVIAPVPWFPFSASLFGRYAKFARAPKREIRRNIEVTHPRYFLAPKIGMTQAVSSLTSCIVREAKQLIANGDNFDLIDAHYLYPDGVAAVRAAKILGKPVVITARGSDVTLLPKFTHQREMILDAIRQCDGVIAVAEALKNELVELGAPAEKITVLRNGVDLEQFRPLDRGAIRARLNLSGPVIASVGHLIERKGHDIAIKAMTHLKNTTLLIVGEGPERKRLKHLAQELGVSERVRFLGAIAHENLGDLYNSADALVLASTHEGLPNVLLEAMACGASVVASDVGGNAEIVSAPEAGVIVKDRTPEAFAEAIKSVLAQADRGAVRRFAENYSWDETSLGLGNLFDKIAKRQQTAKRMRVTPLTVAQTQKPILLITVDTEEAFDWREFDSHEYSVCDPADITRFQNLCAEFSARPLYFITHPVLSDPRSRDYFRQLDQQGEADFGVHPHSWTTPPTQGFSGAYYSWQSNLPADVHAAKLSTMNAAFMDCFGRQPLAHRAGRYGLTSSAYAELLAAGIRYDFSPSPGFDFSASGGPDFSATPNHPFTVDHENSLVVVTPVSGARTLRGVNHFFSQPRGPGKTSHRPWAENLTAPLRITCEGAKFEELVALTRRLTADKVPVITFSLHSTSLTPGGNPYAQDAQAVDTMVALTRRYFNFFTNELGGEIIALTDLQKIYSANH